MLTLLFINSLIKENVFKLNFGGEYFFSLLTNVAFSGPIQILSKLGDK